MGTTNAMPRMVTRRAADAIATRFLRSRHQARIHGPAAVRRTASPDRSAWAPATTAALPDSGPVADAWIEVTIGHVHHQIRHDVGAGGEEDDPLHEWEVLLKDGLNGELADPLAREHRLDDHAARQQPSELEAKHGHDRDQRVPERVAQHDRPLSEALRPSRRDVRPPQDLQHRGPREPGD